MHNFIKDHHWEDVDYFEQGEDQTEYAPTEDPGMLEGVLMTSICMNEKRDRIANEMWADYVNIMSHWGRAI